MKNSKLNKGLIIFTILIMPLAVYGSYPGSTGTAELSDPDEWQIQVSPYFWLPGIKGSSTVSGSTAAMDLSFCDIVDNFDIYAFSTRMTAWKGDYELIFDGLYINLDGDFKLETPGPGPTLDVDVTIAQGDMDFALGYKLFEVPIGDKPGQKMSFVPYGGFRYVYLKQEIEVGSAPTLGTSKDWVEPLIGAQLIFDFSEKLSGVVYSDFGGFGIGSASTLTWNLLAGIDYRFGKKHSLKLGYRVYDIDYSNGSGSEEFAFDVKMQGPWLGLTMHF